MMLPSWTLKLIVWAMFLHLSQFFIYGLVELPEESTNPKNTFDILQEFATFQVLPIEPWLSFILFFTATFPLLLILAAYVFTAFNNAVTGAALGLTVVVVGLIALFA